MSNVQIDIRDDLPLPRRLGGRTGSKYPFSQLEVGQCFVVNGGAKPATVRSAVGGYTKTHKELGRKFAVRVLPEGVGVWRVA